MTPRSPRRTPSSSAWTRWPSEGGDEPDPEALDVEADPADVAEQSRSVDLDDDEYR